MRRFSICVVSILAFLLSFTYSLIAQERVDFDLTKVNDHFFFQTKSVQGNSLQIMLESGLPAFLVNRDFYEQNRSAIHFDASDSKIRLLNELYHISFVADGKVNVGEAVYEGPIFVLDDFVGYRMPIQYLGLPSDSTALVLVDLPNGRLSVLPRNCVDVETRLIASIPMEIDKRIGFPVVKDTIIVESDSSTFALYGRLIVDFGSPMLLFLRKQHSSIMEAIDQGLLALSDAYNQQGVVVSQGFYAQNVTLLGYTFQEMTIGVTDKMPAIDHLGFLGIPFFDKPVLFDFNQGRMMLDLIY